MKLLLVLLLEASLWLIMFWSIAFSIRALFFGPKGKSKRHQTIMFGVLFSITVIYSLSMIWYHEFDSFTFQTSAWIPSTAVHLIPSSLPPWNAPFSNVTDELKQPNNSYRHWLYQGESEYFQKNFIHYKDSWQNITNTNWSVPSKIRTSIKAHKKYKRWDWSIVDYPIYPFFLRSRKQRTHDMITIVTQCSLNRLPMVNMVAHRWNEIISLAIYIPLEESLNDIQHTIYNFWHEVETNSSAILDIHLLFEFDRISKPKRNVGLFSIMYPVNHLRNVALQCAQSKYVLLTDADFVPSHRFNIFAKKNFQNAQQLMAQNQSRYNASKLALVIPAFELNLLKTDQFEAVINSTHDIPLTKSKMVTSLSNEETRVFHSDRCPRCHAATNLTKWMSTNTRPYEVQYSSHYEPYIMTERVGLRRYDARFRGYGLNKIYHLKALNALENYTWMVSSHCFLFHIPHEQSRDHRIFRQKQQREWLYALGQLAAYELRKERDAAGYITA